MAVILLGSDLVVAVVGLVLGLGSVKKEEKVPQAGPAASSEEKKEL